MRDAEAWLRERIAGAPPALMQAMIDSLPDEAASVSEALVQGAVALYQTVAAGSGGREDALPLLAADALLTHAFQARAEEDPSGLSRFAEEVGARGRLGQVGA